MLVNGSTSARFPARRRPGKSVLPHDPERPQRLAEPVRYARSRGGTIFPPTAPKIHYSASLLSPPGTTPDPPIYHTNGAAAHGLAMARSESPPPPRRILLALKTTPTRLIAANHRPLPLAPSAGRFLAENPTPGRLVRLRELGAVLGAAGEVLLPREGAVEAGARNWGGQGGQLCFTPLERTVPRHALYGLENAKEARPQARRSTTGTTEAHWRRGSGDAGVNATAGPRSP